MNGGSTRMKESESSYTVKSSSFGITGGRYVHSNINRAAIKAARQLFFKAQKRRPSGANNRVVEFQLVDITKGKGDKRNKPAFYRVSRKKKTPKQFDLGSMFVSEWDYKVERLPANKTTVPQ